LAGPELAAVLNHLVLRATQKKRQLQVQRQRILAAT
jgi:hypothetical protein